MTKQQAIQHIQMAAAKIHEYYSYIQWGKDDAYEYENYEELKKYDKAKDRLGEISREVFDDAQRLDDLIEESTGEDSRIRFEMDSTLNPYMRTINYDRWGGETVCSKVAIFNYRKLDFRQIK